MIKKYSARCLSSYLQKMNFYVFLKLFAAAGFWV